MYRASRPIKDRIHDHTTRIFRADRGGMPIDPHVVIVIIIIVAVAIALTIFSLPNFQFLPFGRVTGSGNLVTRIMDFEDFTTVEVGYAFEVEITQSTLYGVSITADDNVFDYIQVTKTDERLTIGLAPGNDYGSLTLRAKVTMPELHELVLSGATRGTLKEYSSTHWLNVVLSGASNLNMEDVSTGDTEIVISGGSWSAGGIMVSGNTELTVSGGSRAELDGSSDGLTIDCSGGSTLDLADFAVHDANVILSGGSQATINLDGRLDGDLSGGSQLFYIGNPTLGDINTSGGSTIGSG